MLKLVSFSDEHPSRFRWDSFPPPSVPKNEINLFPPLSRAANSQAKSTSNYRQGKICLFCLSEYLISTVGLLSLPLHHYVFSLWPGESDGPRNDLSPTALHRLQNLPHSFHMLVYPTSMYYLTSFSKHPLILVERNFRKLNSDLYLF